jgi:hypothetical protein
MCSVLTGSMNVNRSIPSSFSFFLSFLMFSLLFSVSNWFIADGVFTLVATVVWEEGRMWYESDSGYSCKRYLDVYLGRLEANMVYYKYQWSWLLPARIQSGRRPKERLGLFQASWAAQCVVAMEMLICCKKKCLLFFFFCFIWTPILHVGVN